MLFVWYLKLAQKCHNCNYVNSFFQIHAVRICIYCTHEFSNHVNNNILYPVQHPTWPDYLIIYFLLTCVNLKVFKHDLLQVYRQLQQLSTSLALRTPALMHCNILYPFFTRWAFPPCKEGQYTCTHTASFKFMEIGLSLDGFSHYRQFV